MNIISLAPSNTEILYALGAGEEVVATTSLCDYPAEAAKKPSIGGWTNPKISRIHEFNPDLILASDDLQDDAVEKIMEEGYPVLQVKPHSLEEVYESIRTIGERIDREKEAEKVVDEMKQGFRDVNLNGNPRIYCEEWMDPPMISGNWIPDLIKRIGGKYFIDGGRSRKFPLENLKEFDPEYIIFNICGAGENLKPRDVIDGRSNWQGLTAVGEGNVYRLDDSLLNRPGPRLVEAAQEIEKIINS